MKTLYISDLDGTLLNNDAVISTYSKSVLKRLTNEGIQFSVATARTSATVLSMLKDTGVNAPIVLMNGVCIYDTEKDEYIKTEIIPAKARKNAQDILDAHELFGFWYSVTNGTKLNTYFVKPGSVAAVKFIEERERLYGKVFTRLNDFSECLGFPLIYYSICDIKEKLEAAAEELKEVDGLRIEFYCDTYIENHWYLEICAADASKRNAIRFLRKYCGYDKVVCFGDNFNDLPMFEESDECYAMSNAVEIVKQKATAVIGDNDDDGVAKWLEMNAKRG